MIQTIPTSLGHASAIIYKNPFTGSSDVVNFENVWLPELDLYEMSISAPLPPGAGTACTLAAYNNATQTGNGVSLSGATDTSVVGDVDGQWAESTDPLAPGFRSIRATKTGSPLYQPGAMAAFVYQSNAINPAMSVHVGGDSEFNMAPTTAWRYFSICRGNAATAGESNAQIVWPTDGTFKYLKMQYKASASSLPHNIYWRFRLDGVDTTMAYVLPSELTTAAYLLDDIVTEVPVMAGQLVSVGFARSHGTGTATFACTFSIGFIST